LITCPDRVFQAGLLPTGPQTAGANSSPAKDIGAGAAVVFVIGGLYGRPFLPRFHPTERGRRRHRCVLIGRADRPLTGEDLASLLQATRTPPRSSPC